MTGLALLMSLVLLALAVWFILFILDRMPIPEVPARILRVLVCAVAIFLMVGWVAAALGYDTGVPVIRFW